jgi:hypothetical protein
MKRYGKLSMIPSPVTGRPEYEQNVFTYNLKKSFSTFVTAIIMAMVVFTTFSIYFLKATLQVDFENWGIPVSYIK